jgi:TolB-like protein/class 3 adenylate cyclase/Tfp pilus assembly protein PilF
MIPEDIKPEAHRTSRAGKMQRRLVAVLGADILGYSALMGRAEESIHRRVGDELKRILREAERSKGRVFTFAGDSVMAEFSSAVEALRCAIRIQESSARRNAKLVPNDRILFRIGLTTGEVVVQGDRIGGTTVNVAARLEALAEPGGISLSSAVFEQVRRTISAPYALIGQRRLKNIRDPVLVYGISTVAFAPGGIPWPASRLADAATTPQEFGRQPAIAVLPFRSYASEDEPFADALTEELINALSRWRSFPVIARDSVFAYRGRDLDVRVIGGQLGARYIISGNVQRRGPQVRLMLDLVDVETAGNLLSEQYDRSSSDPFALQDELVRAIGGVLAPEVLKLERERAVRRPGAEAGVYDLYERGMWHRYRDTREDLEKAEVLFRQVLEIDPTYARATAALSLCRNFAAISRWVQDIAAAHVESLALARRAVTDDPRDPHAHFALGVACMNNSRRPEAIEELSEAIRLNPSHAFAHANLGHIFNYLNRPIEALPCIELALRLNPHDPRRFMWLPYLAASHYLAGRYRECLAACEQALVANPGYPHAVRYLVAALGQLGRTDEAGQLLPLMTQIDRDLTGGSEELCRSLFVPEAADHIVEGWRLAGYR